MPISSRSFASFDHFRLHYAAAPMEADPQVTADPTPEAADRPAETAPAPKPRVEWWTLPDEQLLDVRMCDLGLTIDGSILESRNNALNAALAQRQVVFRPHFWLSDEWFTPDGVGGIAIPFYLAHPRLEKLEESQMLEVEGGDLEWCMKILRHEAGHAIDNAYHLQRRRKRLKLFGQSSTPYPEYYTPKPYSKSFVLHLDSW